MSHHPGSHSKGESGGAGGGASDWSKLFNPNPRTPRGGGQRERGRGPSAASVELKALRMETRAREAANAMKPRRSPPSSTAMDRARDTARRVRMGGPLVMSK